MPMSSMAISKRKFHRINHILVAATLRFFLSDADPGQGLGFHSCVVE